MFRKSLPIIFGVLGVLLVVWLARWQLDRTRYVESSASETATFVVETESSVSEEVVSINEDVVVAPEVTPVPVVNRVLSIESMNQTKDRVCNQPTETFVLEWVQLAKEAGATHVTIATPYDSPACGDALAYAKRWADAIHDAGLHVWWRQMFLEFEGIYDASMIPDCEGSGREECRDYVAMMVAEIWDREDLYHDGDVFSATAEPGAGRIRGISCFADVCMFESTSGSWNAIPEFNEYLVRSMQAAEDVFADLGKDVSVNAGGLDLFVAVGFDNPDWGCGDILYPTTVRSMGGFVMDHYFDPERSSMVEAMEAVAACYPVSEYPELVFGIGEWGPIMGGATSEQIERFFVDIDGADERFGKMINIWQGGPAGQESLFRMEGDGLAITQNYRALSEYFGQ